MKVHRFEIETKEIVSFPGTIQYFRSYKLGMNFALGSVGRNDKEGVIYIWG